MIHLLIIDPQNDFVDRKGALSVPGAEEDMGRLTKLVRSLTASGELGSITVTLDTHPALAIERPSWWRSVADDTPPETFTTLGIHPDGKRIVEYALVGFGSGGHAPTDREYTTANPEYLHGGPCWGRYGEEDLGGSFGYIKLLEKNTGSLHTVWPPHCIQGSWGACVFPELHEAIIDFETAFGKADSVKYIEKGKSPWTEHLSAFGAVVGNSNDERTLVQFRLVDALMQGLGEQDVLLIAGEALSHCVRATVRDLHRLARTRNMMGRIVLLTDACSSVPGFEYLGEELLEELPSMGILVGKTTDYLR